MHNPDQQRQRLLRLALTCNALFSLASGLFITLADRFVVHSLGLADGSSLMSLGIGLIAFAIFLFLSARRPLIRVFLARIIVLMDVLWVICSYALLFIVPFSFGGTWMVVIVADVVLAFGIAQWLGIRKIRKGELHA